MEIGAIMVMRASEKIIDGLTQLLEGFSALQSEIEDDYTIEQEEIETASSDDVSVEMDAAAVVEIRAAIETVMDTEDYGTDEIAAFLSVLTDALEEIDPDVFEEVQTEPSDLYAAAEEEYDEDDDELDDDLDDFDDEEFDDEEEEDEEY